MDDTKEDRAAIQEKLNQVDFYPLKDFDGKMKTIDWKNTPDIPTPNAAKASGGETRWGIPEKFFDQLPKVLDLVPPLPGEEALYGQFRLLLDAANKDPAIKKLLVQTAVESEQGIIKPFFEWKHNGRPAGNGWNRSTNNAQFGIDYFKGDGKPDPAPAVKAAETTRVYPLFATEKDVKPMEFPDASGKALNMMYPTDNEY